MSAISTTLIVDTLGPELASVSAQQQTVLTEHEIAAVGGGYLGVSGWPEPHYPVFPSLVLPEPSAPPGGYVP